MNSEVGYGAARRLWTAICLSFAMLSSACTPADAGEACQLDDADGIIGGEYRFSLTVDDTKFAPSILKAQNSASIRLELTNAGTTEHDFAIDCLPTPNPDGCPPESCFEDEARIGLLEPGASASTVFEVPRAEGIYVFRSSGDASLTGQFIVQ